MANKIVVLMVGILAICCLASVVNAAQGTATFYTRSPVPSSCYGNENKGVMIAAASAAVFENGRACGRRYRVTCIGGTNATPNPCKGGSVDVTIVDYCPPGCAATLDLSQEAFARIANPDAGKVRIEYNQNSIV
ncbi:hypothetical protein K2173_015998 [Erythroxylum novogranatense]|uniref:Expansin-like EG45 domain-containing protein n=1 Tax=Erythroxylum novogranatense TaxID=1862640 RepID=A0AAV8SEY3_9ROSI|nr:hypothetical protein K2173_015998 [Erythroxylum novogranatense]